VVVVGGGISGLVAARRLDLAGARVTLVEKTRRLGGMVMTELDDGFVVEGGPDSFVAAKGAVLALAGELGIDDEVISSRPEHRGSFVWWDGELHPLPGGLLLMVPSRLRPLFASSLLTWRGKMRVLGDLVLPRSTHDEDVSLESFVTRRLGRQVLERIAEPLIAGVHAARPDTMSLRASFPRFLEMEREHRSLILAARSFTSRSGPPDVLSHFASFRSGMGRLTSAMTGSLQNTEVRTGAGVTALGAGPSGYRVRLDDGSELAAGSVVLSAPAPVVSGLLGGLAPEAASALSEIRQVTTAALTLAYRSGDLPTLTGSGFVVPSVQRRRIMGVSYLSQKWEGRVPDPELTLIRAFVGGWHGQELAKSTGDLLQKVVGEELKETVGIMGKPVRSWSHVWHQGLHQYTLGHLDRVATAERALDAFPGLALAGAGFHGIGLNECIDSGERAAASVMGTLSRPVAAKSWGGH